MKKLIALCVLILLRKDPEAAQIFSAPDIDYGIITTLAYSPDGNYLAGGAANPGGSGVGILLLWDAHTGSLVQQLSGRYDSPFVTFPDFYDIQFSPDSRYIAGSTFENNTFVWDVETGEQILSVSSQPHPVAFHPSGEALLTSTDNDFDLVLYDIETATELNRYSAHQAEVTDTLFSPDGETLYTTDSDGLILVWDTATASIRQRSGVDGSIFSIDLDTDTNRLLLAAAYPGFDFYSYPAIIEVTLWDTETMLSIYSFGNDFVRFNDMLTVSFLSDGHVAVAAINDEALFWDIDTPELIVRISTDDFPADAANFNPNLDELMNIPIFESFAVSPDEDQVAFGLGNESVFVALLNIKD